MTEDALLLLLFLYDSTHVVPYSPTNGLESASWSWSLKVYGVCFSFSMLFVFAIG